MSFAVTLKTKILGNGIYLLYYIIGTSRAIDFGTEPYGCEFPKEESILQLVSTLILLVSELS